MDALSAFHFLRPAWLLLLLPFVMLSLLQWRRNDLRSQWQPVIAAHLLPRMIVRGSQRRLFSPFWVSVVLSPLLVVALAGPSWQRGESPFAEDNAALVIAVDLSQSMAGRDVQPSRLQRARDKILQLVDARGDAYTGLLAYAGSAHTVLPLSNDATVLLHYLDALRVGMLPREGKAPEQVIPLALSLLAERGRAGTLLLLSDGAANASAAPFENLREHPELQLLVWGIGKTQAEIDADTARGLDSRAQPLQEAQLQAIARAAGGHYQRLTPDDHDLRALQRRIERQYLAGEDSSRPWIDGGYYLLWPIMLLFLLWFRPGWVLRW
jgi:Ca-activated chloride channel family protein